MNLPARLILCLMFGLSAVLPICGVVGLYRTATREARLYAGAESTGDGEGPSFGQFNVMTRFMHEAIPTRPKEVRSQFVSIGAGVLLAAAASIWAVLATP